MFFDTTLIEMVIVHLFKCQLFTLLEGRRWKENARFLREKAIPTVHEVVEDLDVAIFQDDQDLKHRTQAAMDVVYDLFEEMIESNDVKQGETTYLNVLQRWHN